MNAPFLVTVFSKQNILPFADKGGFSRIFASKSCLGQLVKHGKAERFQSHISKQGQKQTKHCQTNIKQRSKQNPFWWNSCGIYSFRSACIISTKAFCFLTMQVSLQSFVTKVCRNWLHGSSHSSSHAAETSSVHSCDDALVVQAWDGRWATAKVASNAIIHCSAFPHNFFSKDWISVITQHISSRWLKFSKGYEFEPSLTLEIPKPKPEAKFRLEAHEVSKAMNQQSHGDVEIWWRTYEQSRNATQVCNSWKTYASVCIQRLWSLAWLKHVFVKRLQSLCCQKPLFRILCFEMFCDQFLCFFLPLSDSRNAQTRWATEPKHKTIERLPAEAFNMRDTWCDKLFKACGIVWACVFWTFKRNLRSLPN